MSATTDHLLLSRLLYVNTLFILLSIVSPTQSLALHHSPLRRSHHRHHSRSSNEVFRTTPSTCLRTTAASHLGLGSLALCVKRNHDNDSSRVSRHISMTHKPTAERRRDILKTLSGTTTSLLLPLLSQSPIASAAATNPPPPPLTNNLRKIPAYVIVNSSGQPYMIVGKQSREAIGYFFVTLSGARDVLSEARRKAAEGNYVEVWEDARITIVPLEIALQLGLRLKTRVGQKDLSLDSICDVVPSAEALDDARPLDNTGMFTTKGRVPIFYIPGMETTPSTSDDTAIKQTPVYFDKKQLLRDWRAQQNSDSAETVPQVRVRDLTDTFKAIVSGGGGKKGDLDVMNVVFVPVESSVEDVKQIKLESAGVKYKVDEMVMVGGS